MQSFPKLQFTIPQPSSCDLQFASSRVIEFEIDMNNIHNMIIVVVSRTFRRISAN